MTNVRKAIWLLRGGRYGLVFKMIRRWWRHDAVGIGLVYDPRVPISVRLPRVDMDVRPVEPSDLPTFTDLPRARLGDEDVLVRINARHLLGSPLQTCYVGITDAGPVYLQYLIMADQNALLDETFGGLFPPLAPSEALIEFAYTLETHRGGGIMPTGTARLIEIARERGVERLVTYISTEKAAMLRFFMRLGFAPFAVRHERRSLLRRRVAFEPIGADAVSKLLRPRPGASMRAQI